MANINLNSIMNKVEKYAESSDGKKKIKEYREQVLSGARPSKIGRHGCVLLSKDDMEMVAGKMIHALNNIVSTYYSLPDSVLSHFQSLTNTVPQALDEDGTQYIVRVYFEDNLYRPSLMGIDDTPTGEGIHNIVSLFNTGYHASREVEGFWESHETEVIKSLQDREPLGFMEEAVDAFNGNYGSQYNVEATLAEYDLDFSWL